MKKLINLFNEHDGKVIHKWIHYLEIYERYFEKFVGTPVKILEIGVENGGSLQLWKKYFGDKCEIIGIDVNEKVIFEEPQIKIEIGSQSDLDFLTHINDKYGEFDIIIDDGSHMQLDVLTTFSFLYSKLKRGGVYCVEDTHSAYLRTYSGGITSPFNFISISSRLVHDTNVEFIQEPYTPTLNDLKSIGFYNSMVVFEKTNREKIYSTYRGKNHNTDNIEFTPEKIKKL
jgi:SAM-dependent methyltransferase